MFCCKCQNDLEDCVCPDLAERMRGISDKGDTHVASRWCVKCDNHYSGCLCEEPDWKLRSGGKFYDLPSVGALPTPQEDGE